MRTLQNKPGTTYDANNPYIIFAEDWNALVEAIGTGGGGAAGDEGDIQVNDGEGLAAVDGLRIDMTGNARGSGAFDLQNRRTNETQVASGNCSFALGGINRASGNCSFALGVANTANDFYGTTIGMFNQTHCTGALAFGRGNRACGEDSTAIGMNNYAIDFIDTAIGYGSTASGYMSIAMGMETTASGYLSTAMGMYVTASAEDSMAVGSSFTNSTANSLELGVGSIARVRVSAAGLNMLGLPIIPGSRTDASSANNTIYYSTTQSKLVYKDSGGTVRVLY
jgi:hypothetical protein